MHLFLILAISSLLLLASCAGKSQQKEKIVYSTNNHNKDSLLWMLTYGFPPEPSWKNVEKSIAKKYGFEYYWVAGCVVSEELTDSVEKHNKVVRYSIEKKHGKNWEQKFNEELKTAYEFAKKAEKLVKQQSFFIKKDKELRKENKHNEGLYLSAIPINETNDVFKIKAYGSGILNGKTQMVIYFIMKVDVKNNKVELLSDKMQPMVYD